MTREAMRFACVVGALCGVRAPLARAREWNRATLAAISADDDLPWFVRSQLAPPADVARVESSRRANRSGPASHDEPLDHADDEAWLTVFEIVARGPCWRSATTDVEDDFDARSIDLRAPHDEPKRTSDVPSRAFAPWERIERRAA